MMNPKKIFILDSRQYITSVIKRDMKHDILMGYEVSLLAI